MAGARAATTGETTPACTVALLDEYVRLEDRQILATSRCMRVLTGRRRGIARPITELPKVSFYLISNFLPFLIESSPTAKEGKQEGVHLPPCPCVNPLLVRSWHNTESQHQR